jgi:hypothetical protein
VSRDEDTPPAVVHAEAGERAWAEVARLQRDAVPDHADFYALAAALVPTFYAVQDVVNVLRSQVVRYGEARAVYDDTRTVDPGVGLAEAAEQLARTRDALAAAHRYANGFWSAISHISVEDQP